MLTGYPHYQLKTWGGIGNKRKALARQARRKPGVTFLNEEVNTQLQPHNDVFVVVARIDHEPTRWMLVDGGSLANVLPLTMLCTLGWDLTNLKRCALLLVGFSGERLHLEGSIELPLTLGEGKEDVTRIEEFMVIDGLLAYNTILGRLAIHNIRAVPFTYHQTMKFPTLNEMRTLDEQQRASEECYATTMKEPKIVGAINILEGEPEPDSSTS